MPQPQTVQMITVPGDTVLPESEGINPANGDLYVGSTYNGQIQKFTPTGTSSVFLSAHADGINTLGGIAIDPVRSRLWVLNIDLQNPVTGQIGVRVFDLTTKALLKQLTVSPDGAPHGLNDIALDKDGNAFISDCFSPILWKVDAGLTSLTSFITDSRFTLDPTSFNLNGLDFTPDGKYLMATVGNINGTLNNGDGYFFRINTSSKEVVKVGLQGHPGGDGIAFAPDGTLYTVLARTGLSKVNFSNDYQQATGANLTNTRVDVTNAVNYYVTAVRYYNGSVYVLNSQLDHIFPNMPNYGKPYVPFQVARIPLSVLK